MASKPPFKPAAAPPLVPFSEVRHEQPPDCVHYEALAVRGRIHEWSIPAHRHEDLHQFQLILQGGAVATLDGIAHPLKAPAAIAVAPGTVHGFTYPPDTEGHQLTLPAERLGADAGDASALAGWIDRTRLLPALQEKAAECAQLFEALAAEYQSRLPGRAEALLCHARLIALWFARHAHAAESARRPLAAGDTLARRFRRLVDQHFRQHRPLAFYAASLKVTPGHLSRACRETAGRAALEILHERVILEAKRLLVYTPASVVEISDELGFPDPAGFTRFFTRIVKEAPTVYRTAIRAGERGPDLARPAAAPGWTAASRLTATAGSRRRLPAQE